MRFAVVVFPGSNCDHDVVHVLSKVLEQEVRMVWHKDNSIPDFSDEDCIVLPGGFSYGDYLRGGAIARFSPIMKFVIEFAKRGGLVWGICNGFQILCEAGLLPGILMRNANQRFICKNIHLRIETSASPITNELTPGQVLKIPIAHAEGRYFVDRNGHSQLVENDQILFRYCNQNGQITEAANVNGSLDSIAGICNRERNVIGMMPHPERAAEPELGNEDGKYLFESLLSYSQSQVSYSFQKAR